MKKLFDILTHLNLKTIRFNFRYFPFGMAIRFPVFIEENTELHTLKGAVKITADVYPGMIKIGFGNNGVFHRRNHPCIWEVTGTVRFSGSAMFGQGSVISAGKNATISFGNNFKITAASKIISNHSVNFGNNNLVSWEVMITDTDFHKLNSADGLRLNPDAPVNIGNDVWIGARCTILKGTEIPHGSVIAAASLVTGKLEQSGALYGGVPAKLLRSEINWSR